MCWTTFKQPELKQATEPIPVFKILKKDLTGIYYGFQYNLNEPYFMFLEQPSTSKIGNCSIINRGIHSYHLDQVKLVPNNSFFLIRGFIIYSDVAKVGLDIFVNIDKVMVEGYIPKDTFYYINERGECVSNSIVLKTIKNVQNVLDD